MKEVKAWAFLAGEKGKEYFVTDQLGESLIYFKRPLPRPHPFDFGHKGYMWKPTQIFIKAVNG